MNEKVNVAGAIMSCILSSYLEDKHLFKKTGTSDANGAAALPFSSTLFTALHLYETNKHLHLP